LTHCLAISQGSDANLSCADQLATLKQGPPIKKSARPMSQPEGVGEEKEGAVEFQITLNMRRIPWPCGMAEQCSRRRGMGGPCLSVASLRAAGVGEPRRGPEAPCHGQHGFATFCRNKRWSAAGTKPGKHLNAREVRIGLQTIVPICDFSPGKRI
jgi:hypothetical protein